MAARPRALVLTGFPAIGGPLPKLAPLVAGGLEAGGFEVRLEGWSAHTAAREPLLAKVAGRSADLARVLRRVREWRPDVIYVATAHNWPGLLRDLPLLLTVPRGRPPVVVHLHGSQSHLLADRGHGALRAASRVLARRAAAVLLLSQEELRQWRAVFPAGRYEVVANPFVPDPRAAAVAAGRRPPRQATLLCVARLIPEKGVVDLLDAFALLRRRRACRLVVAGSGPLREALARRAALLGVGADVRLAGYVRGDDLHRLYRDADVFVLPTYFAEGFPLAVVEAMSYGLPVVTTRIRGCADHLEPGRNAVFVPPRDPEALADALDGLLADGEAYRAMAAGRGL